jgi:RHH-type proline utilization regulon transcriptional repressor/proline dehydrogenase/delta 1-pyrroline-5-carboxylate dehydrogenase
MIVDSTAMPEQAIQDVVESAFQSAGQRCSALRILYIQQDIADEFLSMLYGAMDELVISSPWEMDTDLGPVITPTAHKDITDYIAQAKIEGRLLKSVKVPDHGQFVSPSVIAIPGIAQMKREIFGPVLHIATFAAEEIDDVLAAINECGYGLTLGIHTRIDDRVQEITSRQKVGNIYINRNQIGAIVGSQPFGGEGLSGTGPKAGGPNYVPRFACEPEKQTPMIPGETVSSQEVTALLNTLSQTPMNRMNSIILPGPTGESNILSTAPRGTILCLGPTPQDVTDQMTQAQSINCPYVGIAPNASGKNTIDGWMSRNDLSTLENIHAVVLWSDTKDQQTTRQALAQRVGPLIPLITTTNIKTRCQIERHICIDTTAAWGKAPVLAHQ